MTKQKFYRRLLAATSIAAALATTAACRSDAAPQGPPPVPQVSAAEVVAKKVSDWEEFTGRVEAVKSVDIRPRVSGYIEQVSYTEGAEVAKGDVLFVIDQRPYRAELARAEADLDRAQAQFDLAQGEMIRASKLLKTRAISQEVHDQRVAASSQAQAGVSAAQAALDIAKLNMEFTEVRSPISGRTSRAMVTEGNLVNNGETILTTVVSLDPVHVYFEGDEKIRQLYNETTQGATGRNTVLVGLSDEQGFPHEGYLDFVDNQVNPDTGTLRGRAVLANPDHIFTPGVFARVKLLGNETFDALLVDDRAILTDQDRRYVYVVGPDNLAQRRDVKPGRMVDGLRVVDGLTTGDRVIVHGVQKVFFPGMAVDPQPIAMGDPPPAPGASQAGSENTEAEEAPKS